MSNPKVVILCMENRSFDEYFGTFPGAVNFQRDQNSSVFSQKDGNGDPIRPFRASTFSSRITADPNHTWDAAQTSWNLGAMDGWWQAQCGSSKSNDPCESFQTSMSFYAANDIPYHWRLAQKFLLCDNYHCSVLGPTWPNRLFLMSGTIFSAQPLNGEIVPFVSGTDLPAIDSDNGTSFPWTSYPAMLPAEITWKLYDDQLWQPPWMTWPETKGPPPYLGRSWPTTFDLNMLDWLWDAKSEFRGPGSATPGALNYAATHSCADVSAFAADAKKKGTLPAISWIVPPYFCTEHPYWLPADGECYLSRVVDAVIHSPDWTDPGIVLIVTYDENGGFFDHVLPPTSQEGNSQDEAWVTDTVKAGPVGGGFRVPTIIVSPWTVDGGVSSKRMPATFFDHTSIIQYLEDLTDIACANLPADGWRRKTFSSLSLLIPSRKKPVPASEIDLPSPDGDVDRWRLDVLRRVYGVKPTYHENGYPKTLLPVVAAGPQQHIWPPHQQSSYIYLMTPNTTWDGDTFAMTVDLFFYAYGFDPSELNRGDYVPEGYTAIDPSMTYELVGTDDVSCSITMSGVAPEGPPYHYVPQNFAFAGQVKISGKRQPIGATVKLKGSIRSRLTFEAPDASISLPSTQGGSPPPSDVSS